VAKFWNIAFLLTVVFAVFSPALHHPFVRWDDNVHCYDNKSIRRLDAPHLKKIFTTDVNKTYIPLTIFSFALEYHFVQTHPFLYHLDNILLHLGVVFMVYLLAVRLGLTQRAAFLAALVFGIHPMHVESVAWVTQRKDVLYSLFYLLSCWHFVGFLKSQRKTQFIWAVVFGFLSILSKPMAMSLPLVLCLLDWFVRGRMDRAFWLTKIPFALSIFPIAWITYAMNMRGVDLNLAHAPLVWLWSMSFYLIKFMFPQELLPLYELPVPVSLSNPAFMLAVLVALLAVAVVIIFRRHRLLILAFLWFFLSIFFLLRFDDKQDLSFVADRFMYLPSFGLCVLFGFSLDRCLAAGKKLRLLLVGSVGIVFIALGLAANEQTKLWGDEFALWSRIKHFQSAAAQNHLGNYFLARLEYPEAIAYYDRSIAINPTYHKPYSNRGVARFRQGDYEGAIADFTKAILLHPKDAGGAYTSRGYAYARQGQLDLAMTDYNTALMIDPENITAYLNRATIYKDRGVLELALRDMRTALSVDPDDADVKTNIEWLLKRIDNEKIP